MSGRSSSSSSRRGSLRSSSRSKAFAPFQIGDVVEVGGHEHGLNGSWYLATIHKFNPLLDDDAPKLVKLQYHQLLSDKNPREYLIEDVDIIHLRPEAPREARRVFRVNEEVDGYYHDGWWEGIVTSIILDPAQPEKKRYSLFFKTSKEQLEFDDEDELRLHREWVHGVWVPPLEEPAPAAAAPNQHASAAGEEGGEEDA